ncbi:MAG: antibiotic biosynthesis monooxygenase family protein [Acidiferrobacterales bacterium]
MYARLVTLTLEPGNLATAEKLADQAASVIRALEGFKNVTFFGNDATGEYGSLSLWESEDDAKAVGKVTELHIREAVSDILKEQPTVRIFKVYEPRV